MARQGHKGSLILGLIVVLVLFFGGRLLIQQSPGCIERACSYVLYPFLVAQQNIIEPIKHWRAERRIVQDLAQCIDKLSVERDELLETVIELKAELNYLDEIKELLAFKERYQEYGAVITQIIAKHFSDDAHYFLIDAGEKQGVKVDMIAIYHNCLLGRVQEVYPLYSKVVAISDKSCKIAAYCSQTKTEGIHEGSNSLDATALKFVSHLKGIIEGDYLISSGEGGVFPRGFALGRIVASECQGLFYEVNVKPLIDLRQLHYCCLWSHGIEGEDELKVAAGTWTPLPENHKAIAPTIDNVVETVQE
jgi:rod shape-determining protein MreC